VINLDEFKLKQRPEFDPEQQSQGFDETAMKNSVALRLKENSVLDGGRMCRSLLRTERGAPSRQVAWATLIKVAHCLRSQLFPRVA
jgi:hypothetical protein